MAPRLEGFEGRPCPRCWRGCAYFAIPDLMEDKAVYGPVGDKVNLVPEAGEAVLFQEVGKAVLVLADVEVNLFPEAGEAVLLQEVGEAVLVFVAVEVDTVIQGTRGLVVPVSSCHQVRRGPHKCKKSFHHQVRQEIRLRDSSEIPS